MKCPYDFMTELDDWFYWHECVMFYKLTPKQAETNIYFRKRGWKLVERAKYGGWIKIK